MKIITKKEGVRVMVFKSNNISVISWWLVLLVEETTDLPLVTDKLYHIIQRKKGISCVTYNRISKRWE